MTLLKRVLLVSGLSVVIACGGADGDVAAPTGVSQSALTSATQLYLHQTGESLSLDSAAPTGTAAVVEDSTRLKLNGGNPWVDVATWAAAPSVTQGDLTALSGRLWLGLESGKDRDVGFDVRVQVEKNGTIVAASEQLCIQGLSDDPALAAAVAIPFGAFTAVPFDGTADVLSLSIAARIGTDGSGELCSGHRKHSRGLRVYFDSTDRASSLAMSFTNDVAERWVAVSCTLLATAPAGVSSYIDSDGNYYWLPGAWFAPLPGTKLTGTAPPPTMKLSPSELLALLLAAQTLDTSTAGYTTVTGPFVHMMTRQGTLYSAGAPGSKVLVDRWSDGYYVGHRTLTTHNDPAAEVIRRYSCFNPD